MEKVLNFQISLFGLFKNLGLFNNELQSVMKIVSKLTESLSVEKLIPRTFEVNNIDYVAKKINTETRLQMISTDNSTWIVNFLPDRIDVNYFYPGGEEYYTDLASVFTKTKLLCKKVFEAIDVPNGMRLAVNGTFLLRDMNFKEKLSFIRYFTNIPQSFCNNIIKDWSVRYNCPININFSDKHEECNYVINLYEAIGLNSKNASFAPRMMITLDFNTLSETRELRFDSNDLLSFVDNIQPLMETKLQEIDKISFDMEKINVIADSV